MSNTSLDTEALEKLFAGFDMSANKPVNTTVTQPKQETTTVIQPAQTAKTQTDMSLLQSAQVHIKQIEAELNNLFVERSDTIQLMMLAITTGTNMLMLGPPGTAKSKVTQNICSRISGGNYFQWMLNKTSDPSEILGSFSIKAMEDDHFVRVTKGKLPEAHISFIDEVYKSNAPVLNSLLTIMNEKIFYNDGQAVPVPLISLFGASNESPEDESLKALHDRFILRVNLNYVQDTNNKKRMFNNYIDERAGVLGLAGQTNITLDEIKALQEATRTVSISKEIISNFVKCISSLNKEAIYVSDRRQNECLKIMQGSAILNGRTNVTMQDFKLLLYVLWEKDADIPVIEEIITKLINPYDKQMKEFKEQFNKIKDMIENESDTKEKNRIAMNNKTNVEKIVTRINKIINQAAKEGHDTKEFSEYRDSIVNYNNNIVNKALGLEFGTTI